MSEPLDLEPIKARHRSTVYNCANADLPLSDAEADRRELLYEVGALREQIAAVRAIHAQVLDNGLAWCDLDVTPWPCWTIQALD